MDKVSVIIPTYNRFQYLLNAIESVQKQNYKNIEIIVINDCSTDKQYYNHEWNDIIMIHLQKNSKDIFGYGCAGYVRNEGLKVATGKYIAFCDDDDIWFPNKLEIQLNAMEENNCYMSSTDGIEGVGEYDVNKSYKKYNAELHYNTLQSIYKRKNSTLLENGFPKIWNYQFLQIHNCMITSSVVIEKKIMDLINNFKNMRPPGEDYECWMRALQFTDSVYVEDVCFYYNAANYIKVDNNIKLKEKVDGIILILSCQKYKNTRLKEFSLNNKKYNNWRVVTVIGDLFLNNDYKFEYDTLTVKCEDSYIHLLKKLVLSIKYVNELFEIKEGILRCGDDLEFNEDNLITFINLQNKEDFMGQSFEYKDYQCEDNTIFKKIVDDDWMVKYYKTHPEDFNNPQHNLKGRCIEDYIKRPSLWGPPGIIYYLSNKSCTLLVEHMEKINYDIFHCDPFTNSYPYTIEDVGVCYILYYNYVKFTDKQYFFDKPNAIAKHTNKYRDEVSNCIKIVDCFIFYNELNMLFFRLTELYDVVDYFVIVEATHTHKGNKKQLYFEENKDMYKQFLDKVIHIVVDDMPNTNNAWDNENHQRICIDRGVKKLGLNDKDLIMISDCDEIVDSNTLKMIKPTGLPKIMKFEMDMYYYNLTCRGSKWYCAKILPYSQYKEIDNPEKIRHIGCNKIENGGWHFSFFGDVNFIKNKIREFAHQEYNNANYLDDDKIKKQIENNDDVFFRYNEYSKIKLEDNTYLPKNYQLLMDI